MNNISLVGRTTRDIDVRKTQNGVSVASFTLAVDRDRSDGTDFIPVTVFGNTADAMGLYVKKGYLIAVSGRLKAEAREDRDGQRKTFYEVIAERVQFLESKRNNSQYSTPENRYKPPVTSPETPQQAKPSWDEGDFIQSEDLPF